LDAPQRGDGPSGAALGKWLPDLALIRSMAVRTGAISERVRTGSVRQPSAPSCRAFSSVSPDCAGSAMTRRVAASGSV